MSDIKPPEDVAQCLKTIYDEEFGGKPRGRYVISRPDLRELSGRKGRLEDQIISQIISYSLELGLVVTDIGDEFSVVEVDVMKGYRKVPARLIAEFLPQE